MLIDRSARFIAGQTRSRSRGDRPEPVSGRRWQQHRRRPLCQRVRSIIANICLSYGRLTKYFLADIVNILDDHSPAHTSDTHRRTDSDGRCMQLAPAGPLRAGTYKVTFKTKDYFATSERSCFYPWVEVRTGPFHNQYSITTVVAAATSITLTCGRRLWFTFAPSAPNLPKNNVVMLIHVRFDFPFNRALRADHIRGSEPRRALSYPTTDKPVLVYHL